MFGFHYGLPLAVCRTAVLCVSRAPLQAIIAIFIRKEQELSREKIEPFPEPPNSVALHCLVYDVRFAEPGSEFRYNDYINAA